MKTQIRKIYTFSELRKSAKEHAIEMERQSRQNDAEVPWMDEIMDSLKALFKAAGVEMKDWSIGPHDRGTRLVARFNREEVEDLSGPRAMAWLENNLMGGLRVSEGFNGSVWKKPNQFNDNNRKTLKEALKYRYRIGQIPSCPLTGVYCDDDLLDALRKDVKDGMTLKDAFQGLADEAAKLMEGELDSYYSDESIIEDLKGRGHSFIASGDMA